MEVDTQNSANMRPKTMADLLPELKELLDQDSIFLTAKKNPRNGKNIKVTAHTDVKFKPLTIAEMRADLLALTTTKKKQQPTMSASNMKRWNSSVKVDKKFVSHTGDGQMKHNAVRKALDFQQRPQIVINSRATMVNAETPKFPKPESRAKKSLHVTKTNATIRISGVYKISETPRGSKNQARSKFTVANKENISNLNNIKKLPTASHTAVNRKILPSLKPTPERPKSSKKFLQLRQAVPDTPISNESWKSSCDASFLQKEKEINDIEEKSEASEKLAPENITKLTPPVSTPFKNYRNVQEFFNNSSEVENSVHEDTIMSFEKPSENKTLGAIVKDNENMEESDIMSLCDMFTKATVANQGNSKSELEMLLEFRNEIKETIQSQFKLLRSVQKLIKKKTGSKSPDTITVAPHTNPKMTINKQKSPILSQRCSVIRSTMKSPSYKVPKKNSCLRKKIIYKSMPDMPCEMMTPKVRLDRSERGMTMYMKMKEQMNFLKTPLAQRNAAREAASQGAAVPDTPAVSKNLQMQLGRLFNDS